jgi:hypothetical protein
MERQGYASCSMLNGVITNRILPGTKREYSSSDFTCYGLHLDQDQEVRNTSISLMHLDALQSKNHAQDPSKTDGAPQDSSMQAGRHGGIFRSRRAATLTPLALLLRGCGRR